MFQLQELPHTSLEGSGQAQLPQLWLHGVGELLQGPWVQGHSESGFVSGSSEVHFRVLRKPPQEKTSGRRGGSWLAHQPCMKLASPGLAGPPCPCLLLAGSQLGARCCRERGLRSSVPGTSFHPIPPYRTKYPDYSFPASPQTHLLIHFLLCAVGEKETDLTPQLLADLQNRSGVGPVPLDIWQYLQMFLVDTAGGGTTLGLGVQEERALSQVLLSLVPPPVRWPETHLMQVVFVLVSWASTQGHHHHLVFAKEHPTEKKGFCEGSALPTLPQLGANRLQSPGARTPAQAVLQWEVWPKAPTSSMQLCRLSVHS